MKHIFPAGLRIWSRHLAVHKAVHVTSESPLTTMCDYSVWFAPFPSQHPLVIEMRIKGRAVQLPLFRVLCIPTGRLLQTKIESVSICEAGSVWMGTWSIRAPGSTAALLCLKLALSLTDSWKDQIVLCIMNQISQTKKLVQDLSYWYHWQSSAVKHGGETFLMRALKSPRANSNRAWRVSHYIY